MKIENKTTRILNERTYCIYDESEREIGTVVITFENGKFLKCDFPFRGLYTREQWAVLSQIEAEISRIEETYLHAN